VGLRQRLKKGNNMQYDNQVSEQWLDHETLFTAAKHKTIKARKWRENEEVKARQRLIPNVLNK
jgi:hypothetical protein